MNLLNLEATKQFNATPIQNDRMEVAKTKWNNVAAGHPEWLDAEDNIRTINFGKFIASWAAKKATLELSVSISGSKRAEYINSVIAAMVKETLRSNVEIACYNGGIILKPNGNIETSNAIDYVTNFITTEKDSNGNILGAIFPCTLQKEKKFYTRLEYHRFVNTKSRDKEGNVYDKTYVVSQKAFVSSTEDRLGKEIPLSSVPEWAKLIPESYIYTEKPLFAYFKMPFGNTIDPASPEGVSIFSNAMEELRDLDIAWSRKSQEIEDSKHITFVSDDNLNPNRLKERQIKLPRFVKGLDFGVNEESTIHEHVATLLTEQRTNDINSVLAMISTKCEFSQGQFVLDGKTGTITATEINADCQETIQTISDIRRNLISAIKNLCYALDVYCDIYGYGTKGYVNVLDSTVEDDDIFYFDDLINSFEEDRARAYNLATQGVISWVTYLTRFEGFGEDEAKEEIQRAKEERQQPKDIYEE